MPLAHFFSSPIYLGDIKKIVLEKRSALLGLIICFFGFNSFAQQSKIDSLDLALKSAKHDSTRCNLLNTLIRKSKKPERAEYAKQLKKLSEENLKRPGITPRELKIFKGHHAGVILAFGVIEYENGNYSSALEFYQNALKEFEELKDKKSTASALYNMGLTYFMKSDNVAAIECFTHCLQIREEIKDQKGIAGVLNSLGLMYYNQGELAKAIESWEKCLKIRRDLKDKVGESNVLNSLAANYSKMGNIPKALEYFAGCLRLSESMDDKEGVAQTLNGMASIYKDLGDYEKAHEYYSRSLKNSEEIGNKRMVASSLNNLGNLYEGKRDYTNALNMYNKSLKIREEDEDKSGIAMSYLNIGNIYNARGKITEALNYFEKGLNIYIETGDKSELATTLTNIGSIYSNNNNHSKAISYGSKALNLAEELGYPDEIMSAAELLTVSYKGIGNFRLAMQNYELFIKMRDSITNQENKKASYKSHIKYDFEKQALADSLEFVKEKEVKQKEIEKQKAEIKVKKNQQYALFGGLALVIVFAGFMYNRFKVTQKQKAVIEQQKQIVEEQKVVVEAQKHLVEEKHKEITDSINYAERIQRSFLATKEHLDANLSEYFVLFKPKDVVSGDFYWSSILNNNNFILATADSTGHGVPGAIMSLLNITSLEKAIEQHNDPAQILNDTRKTIITRLKKDGSENGGKDGMDCSLLVFDFKKMQLYAAAANNPVWIVRGNEVIEIKPDKMPVGKHDRDQESFTNHTIGLMKGDTIYALTDGFPDQFGGPKGKKFMSKNLRELLVSNVSLPLSEQKLLLEKTFKDWVGDLEQVDDVTVIGIRI